MALFRKKQEETAAPTPVKEEKARVQISDHAGILSRPRITEKATMESQRSVYVFDVAPTATKRDIAAALARVYKVVPRKIRVAAIPTKRVRNMRTGKGGVKRGGKKAYVYLAPGETITLT